MPNPPPGAYSDDVLVRVEGVGKKFCRDLKKSLWYGMRDIGAELLPGSRDLERHATLRLGEFWAVDDVSFELRRGESLGLIGRNGAGKTTLLRMLNGLIKPDKGRIEIRGRVGALIALGAGFNPILTGRENIYVNGSVLGLRRREVDAKLEEIVEFAELADFIDAPVQSYSSGMVVRLGFAIASTMQPDILLVDEVLAVGDAAFRIKCYNRIFEIREQTAVIFVSHSMAQVGKISNVGLVLNKGVSLGGKTLIASAIREYNDRVPVARQSFEGSEPDLICDVAIRAPEGAVSAFFGRHDEASRPLCLEAGSSVSFELTCAGSAHSRNLLVVWSATSPEQQLVCQTLSEPVSTPADNRQFSIVTTIRNLPLNRGVFTLSVHVFANQGDGRGSILAGWRDFGAVSITHDQFCGVAPVLCYAETMIAQAHGGSPCS